jgi:hypothetical protein
VERYNWIKDTSRRTLAAMATCMDDALSRLVDTLKMKNMWSNTLFVFFADNGGPPYVANSNWPMRGGKWTMWEVNECCCILVLRAFVSGPCEAPTGTGGWVGGWRGRGGGVDWFAMGTGQHVMMSLHCAHFLHLVRCGACVRSHTFTYVSSHCAQGGTHLAAFAHHGGGKIRVGNFTGLMHHCDWAATLVDAAGGTMNDTAMPPPDSVSQWGAMSAVQPSQADGSGNDGGVAVYPRSHVLLNVDQTNQVSENDPGGWSGCVMQRISLLDVRWQLNSTRSPRCLTTDCTLTRHALGCVFCA